MVNNPQKTFHILCFYKKTAIFVVLLLHIDGCRSICKKIDKNKNIHKKSHPDKADGSYFLYKKLLK